MAGKRNLYGNLNIEDIAVNEDVKKVRNNLE